MDEKIKSQLFDLDETIIGVLRRNQEKYDAGAITKDLFEENEFQINFLWHQAGELREAAKRGKNSRLQLARENAGLSQGQLAERVGVSRVWIHLIENGKKNGSGKMRNKISNVLNTDSAILWPNIEITQPKAAKWGDELTEDEKRVWAEVDKVEVPEKAAHKDFSEKVGSLFAELGKKVDGTIDSPIFDNIDYQIGFQEILWLAKKYGIKFPKGIL
jgi:transcriptional regulator with XRE-family HTH domain